MKQKLPAPAGHREATHVFSKEIAAQVRRIELRTKGLVESLFSGEYHSVFKGRGLEFSDVREYQPGDDVRAIDWNVTARRGDDGSGQLRDLVLREAGTVAADVLPDGDDEQLARQGRAQPGGGSRGQGRRRGDGRQRAREEPAGDRVDRDEQETCQAQAGHGV